MSRTIKRPYTKSKRFSRGCRCHGGCGWCESNRLYSYTRNKLAAEEQIKNIIKGVPMCERRQSNKCVDETNNVDDMCSECLDEYLGRNYGCEYPDDIPDEQSTEDWYRNFDHERELNDMEIPFGGMKINAI